MYQAECSAPEPHPRISGNGGEGLQVLLESSTWARCYLHVIEFIVVIAMTFLAKELGNQSRPFRFELYTLYIQDTKNCPAYSLVFNAL